LQKKIKFAVLGQTLQTAYTTAYAYNGAAGQMTIIVTANGVWGDDFLPG
jgi:hypothetical protein